MYHDKLAFGRRWFVDNSRLQGLSWTAFGGLADAVFKYDIHIDEPSCLTVTGEQWSRWSGFYVGIERW